MNKQVISLVLSLIVVLVLFGLLAFLLLDSGSASDPSKEITPGESTASSPSKSEIQLLPDLDKSDLNTVTISNQSGSYTLVNHGNSYTIQGLENIKTSKAQISELTASLTNLKAIRLILEPEKEGSPLEESQLSQYGLDNSVSAIQIVTIDQEEHTLLVGKEAPSSSGTYVLFAGRVFLVETSSISIFSKDSYSFVDNQITSSAPDSIEEASLVFSGSVRPSPITIQIKSDPPSPTEITDEPTSESSQNNYSYMLTTPVERTLSPEAVKPLLDELFSFYGNKVVSVNPSPDQMSQFGLGEPFSILKADFDGDSYTLRVSTPDDNGYVYIIKDDQPVVFYAMASRITWLTLQYEMLIHAVYTPADITDINRMTVATDKQVFDFVVRNESGGGLSVTCNGSEVDDQAFKTLFKTITPIPPEQYTEASPTLKPALTLTISYIKEDRPPDIIQLTPTGEGSLFLTVNSKTNYTAREELVKLITENCQKILDDEELTKLS